MHASVRGARHVTVIADSFTARARRLSGWREELAGTRGGVGGGRAVAHSGEPAAASPRAPAGGQSPGTRPGQKRAAEQPRSCSLPQRGKRPEIWQTRDAPLRRFYGRWNVRQEGTKLHLMINGRIPGLLACSARSGRVTARMRLRPTVGDAGPRGGVGPSAASRRPARAAPAPRARQTDARPHNCVRGQPCHSSACHHEVKAAGQRPGCHEHAVNAVLVHAVHAVLRRRTPPTIRLATCRAPVQHAWAGLRPRAAPVAAP